MFLYNKKAIVHGYSRNEYGVSKYDVAGVEFKCNIQPLDQADGFDEATVYKMRKLYCDYSGIVVGDKIESDGITYVVKSIQKRDGNLRKFYKLIIAESEGT